MFQSLLPGIGAGAAAGRGLMPLAVGVLALTGGLAAACFVKAFGITFLALPRTRRGRGARTSRRVDARRHGRAGRRLRGPRRSARCPVAAPPHGAVAAGLLGLAGRPGAGPSRWARLPHAGRARPPVAAPR